MLSSAMTFDELVQSLEADAPAKASSLVRALWLARKGKWDEAHKLASDDSSSMAARIHAYLHRVEGDPSNARYWYRQAGVPAVDGTLEDEWDLLARELTS
jgi:hypothetical protein